MEFASIIPWYWIGFALAAFIILVFNAKYPWKADGKTVHTGHLIAGSLRHFADHWRAGLILVLFLAALDFGLGRSIALWSVHFASRDGLLGNAGFLYGMSFVISMWLLAASVFAVGVWAGKPRSTSPNSEPRWIVLGLWYLALKLSVFVPFVLFDVLRANHVPFVYQLGAAGWISDSGLRWDLSRIALGIYHVTLALILAPFLLKLVSSARNDRRVPLRYFSRRTLTLALTVCLSLAVVSSGNTLILWLGRLAATPFLDIQGSGYFLGGASTSWPSLLFISLPQNLWIAFMFLIGIGMLVAAYEASSAEKTKTPPG
ncbi:hypothetical protein [Hyphobacterium marinum]|uniref:Uncharacterized protein n=1 Tax=Hyphobacterium marinum TaxID=3116574 RepID=A0ABU7M142_9PROT|nr:hypothetical protein [Hyphobacterium sp. Y6023]MEE2567242.1 hypothetical protein [Hyphobacterium sp. Y6023]